MTDARLSADSTDVSLKRIQLFACQACLDGVGEECHTPGCAFYLHRVDLPITPELYTIVTDEAVKEACHLCRGAGHVTYRDGIAYETHDVEKEDHLIEDCPECKGSGVIRTPAQPTREGKSPEWFCQWLKGYLGGIPGRDELDAFEANSIRNTLNEVIGAQPPAAPVETDKVRKALEETRSALEALKFAVEASGKLNDRGYIPLGIQVNNALDKAGAALAAPHPSSSAGNVDAPELLAIADRYEDGLKKMIASGYEEFGPEVQRQHRLIIDALRHSAGATNALTSTEPQPTQQTSMADGLKEARDQLIKVRDAIIESGALNNRDKYLDLGIETNRVIDRAWNLLNFSPPLTRPQSARGES